MAMSQGTEKKRVQDMLEAIAQRLLHGRRSKEAAVASGWLGPSQAQGCSRFAKKKLMPRNVLLAPP